MNHLQPDRKVWPPPPLGAAPFAAWFPFRAVDARVQGRASGFQGGWIGIEATGITIHGKMATRSQWSMFVLPIVFVSDHLPHRHGLYLLAAAVAYALVLATLYISRKSTILTLPWSQVRQIVLDEEKHRVGITYDAPDHTNKTKTYSLVFALKMPVYTSFVNAVEQYAPHCNRYDKLSGEDIVVPLMLVLHMFVVIALAFFLSKLIMGH